MTIGVKKAVVLFSGGLDSMLAVRLMQLQGLQVEAINIRTQFACCGKTASDMAAFLGVRLSVVDAGDDYLRVIRNPEFGFGRGANPCVDCRIFMFHIARERMEDSGGHLVVSGEVLGQRPNSQGRRDLERIEIRSGLEGRLLRPLSARLLPETVAEQEGWVVRDQLLGISGRSRKDLIRLAREFGFSSAHIPAPSTGCMLTQKTFAPRVFDLLSHEPRDREWNYEILKIGRHFRITDETKIIVGRREGENEMMEHMAGRDDAPSVVLLTPCGYSGPAVMVIGETSDANTQIAGGLLLKYAGRCETPSQVLMSHRGVQTIIDVRNLESSQVPSTL